MAKYEEHQKWSITQSWLLVFILPTLLISWAMTIMTMVGDVPRYWDFGNLEFTPGKSIYSTNLPEKHPPEMKQNWINRMGRFDTTREGLMPENKMIYPLPGSIPYDPELESNHSKKKTN